MAVEVEYKRVEAFEVKGIQFTCVSRWNGLEEWKDSQGRMAIVCKGYDGGFASSFHQLFSSSALKEPEAGKLVVISAHPDLAQLFEAKQA